MPLHGRTIALAEGRQLEELAQMLEKEGAAALRCPLLSIIDQPDHAAVIDWLHELIAGKFTHIVLLTGEGLRRLLGFAERDGKYDQTIFALSRVKTITRGPKPVQALKQIGLTPGKVAHPPTTDGVIEALKQESLNGACVGVQLYCETNPPLTDYLASAGAITRTVLPYIFAAASDGDRVALLIQKMANGEVDALVFTSSPQVDRIYEMAADRNLEEQLKRGLQRVKIAAVGPIVKEKLLEKGARVDIMPEQGFVMKNLVLHIKRAFAR